MSLHIIRGTAAPATAPTEIGQHFVDTTNGNQYLSTGTSSPTDWKRVDNSGSGVTDFLGLSDSPSSYSGDGGKAVKVNVGESALEFVVDDTFDDLSPLTTGGDLLYGGGSGAGTRLANGSAAQVLTSAGGTSPPTWETPAAGSSVVTTEGDVIVGNGSGDEARLGIGSNAQVLTSDGSTASWETPASGFADPMTTRADIIVRNASNVTARLPKGTASQILQSDGTDLEWVTPVNSTSWFSGGVITINADPTKYDVASGTGVIVNPTTLARDEISWIAKTLVAPANIATETVTHILIDINGDIFETNTEPTNEQQRTYIDLGSVVHLDGVNISIATVEPTYVAGAGVQLGDLYRAVGNINISGNDYSSAASVLTLNKSAGVVTGIGINTGNLKSPNQKATPADAPLTWFYNYETSGVFTVVVGATDIDPENYNDITSGLSPVANNKFQIKRLFYNGRNDTTVIQYGQATYSSIAEAEAALDTEEFNKNPDLTTFPLRGYLIIKKGTTDLTVSANAKFIRGQKIDLGGGSGGGASTSTTTLQKAYDNSSVPQTVLNATNGGMEIEDASSPIGGDLWKISSNGGGSKYFSVSTAGIGVVGNIAVSGTVDGIDIATDVAANTAKVSADGLVTTHSDVSDAGSGIIISAAERTAIGTNTTNNAGSATVHSDIDSGDITNLGNLSGTNTGDVDFDDLSPMTTGGDIIYGGGSGAGARLANGAAGQVLTSAGTTVAPTWETPGGGSGDVVGPASATNNALARFDATTGKLLQDGTILQDDSGNLVSVGTVNTHTIPGGTGTFALTADITGTNSGTNTGDQTFDDTNPMSTGGDIIYGGASGTGTRLANGSASQILTSAGGTSPPTWETPSGLSDPMTQRGDIIIRSPGNATVRLEAGNAGDVLTTVNGLDTTWAAPSVGGAFTIDDTGTRSMTILEEQNVSFEGIECTFYGTQAGLDNTTGDHNTLYGHNCDLDDADDDDATGMGHDVIVRERSVAIGAQAVATGVQGTAVGQASKVVGNNCVAIGITAEASGTDCVVIGATAGRASGGGDECVLVGKGAGLNSTGDDNVMIGNGVGVNGTGARNVVVGKQAGTTMSSGEDNIWIGYQAGLGLNASDRLIIENSSNTTTPLIDGQFSSQAGTRPEFIKINGRFKTTWTIATANFTAIAGDQIAADTFTTGAFTVTLPAGVDGDEVALCDAASNWGSDNLTVTADGSETVLGSGSQVISTTNAPVRLVFFGTNWVTAV